MATEYISREAAMRAIIDKQRDHTTPWRLSYELGKRHAADEYVDVIKAVPAADVVDVVRCKDCIHDNSNDSICPIPWVKRMRDSFCSFGERRADNGN